MEYHLLSCLGIPFKVIQNDWQHKWNESYHYIMKLCLVCWLLLPHVHTKSKRCLKRFLCVRGDNLVRLNVIKFTSFKHVTEIRHDKREYHPKKLKTMIYYQVNFIASISVQVAKHTFKATFMHGKVVSVTRLLLVWIQHHIFQSMTSTIYFSEVDTV